MLDTNRIKNGKFGKWTYCNEEMPELREGEIYSSVILASVFTTGDMKICVTKYRKSTGFDARTKEKLAWMPIPEFPEKWRDYCKSLCPSCGNKVKEGMKFCPECGQKLVR